jgi:cell division transport system permease protein
MGIKTSKYIVKEGLTNVWENSLMTLASVTMIIISLIIFGSFGLTVLNINYIIEQVEEQQQIQVFLDKNISSERREEIYTEIMKIDHIVNCTLETKEEALGKFREKLGDEKSTILEGFTDDNPLRDSYIIKLKDINYTDSVLKRLELISGIVNIKNASAIIDKLKKITRIINVINYSALLALGVIAIFIVVNTIKLTVFARRKEINIMKFVGATDWFIRWPFIIEGMIFGLIGGLISSIIVYFGYQYVTEFVYENVGFFKLKTISEVIFYVILIFCVFGTMIGAIGSGVAVKKHLKV